MDKRTVEQRLETLDGHDFAYGVALRTLIVATFNTDAEMRARRDIACRSVEAIYGQPGVTLGAHQVLQIAIHETEQLFAAVHPATPRNDG